MPSTSPDDTVRLFLSYAREDFEAVSALYDRLEALGLRPWMDKVDILPGEQWETKLSQAIRESHFFLACLSAKSVEKRGYLQREFKQALDLWQEQLDGDIFLIPLLLAACEVPEKLEETRRARGHYQICRPCVSTSLDRLQFGSFPSALAGRKTNGDK